MERKIYSSIEGIVIPIEKVNDPVFSDKMLGDGLAVRPKSIKQTVVAPCDCTVTTLNEAFHAITLQTEDKLDLLIHIGIDTVMLKGEGFKPMVKVGDKVKTGDKLIEVDFLLIASKVPSIDVITVVTNMDDNVKLVKTNEVNVKTGDLIYVVADKDSTVKIESYKAPVQPPADTKADGEVVSPVCTIYNEVGIHARPASVLAQMAAKFKSAVSIKKGERSINAKSMIAIMGLGVKYLEQIQIIAKGEDAQQAVDTLVKAISEGLGEEVKIPAEGKGAVKEDKPAAQVQQDDVLKKVIKDFSTEVALKGVVASPGLVIGESFLYTVEDINVQEQGEGVDRERIKFNDALNRLNAKLTAEIKTAEEKKQKTKQEIFTAHIDILKDETLLEEVNNHMDEGKSAAFAWKKGIKSCIDTLKATNNPLLIERTADYKDIERQVLKIMLGLGEEDMTLPPGTIVVANDLVPSDMIKFGDIAGVVLAEGSSTSHVSLIIRNMGTPALVAMGESVLNIPARTSMILDANEGVLTVNPDKVKMEEIRKKESELREIKAKNVANALKPAVTTDGVRIYVKGNISNSEQAGAISDLGAEGIGLFRTEFLFFNSRTAPEEDMQYGLYKDVVDAVKGDWPVTLRTLDVGGDKPLAYVSIPHEENPILGIRGVRNYQGNKDIFVTQIRAILRIKPLSRVKIMIPMVSDIFEIRWAKEVIEEEKKKMGITEPVSVGTMIEVPSAALISREMAKYVDFFSIGTNDLTQYTLAMDRGNPHLTARLNNLHPAVLKLIKATVEGGNSAGISTAICGAMASEVRAVPILVGLGITELSASMRSVPDVKALIRELSHDKCRQAAEQAVLLGSAQEVEELVRKEFNL